MKKDYFYFSITIILLLIVLVGFAPSFYLRSINHPNDPIPFYIIVHGMSCTAWFVIIVLQSYWVNTNHIKKHIKFGKYFSLLVPLLVLSGFAAVYYGIVKYHAYYEPIILGAEIEIRRQFLAGILFANVIILSFHLLFVYLGYRFKFKANFHKRFMLLASIMIVQQALVRLGMFEILMIGEDKGASGGIYAMIGPLIFILFLLIYDLFKLKKPHRATILGLGCYLLFLVLAFFIMSSGLALEWIEALR